MDSPLRRLASTLSGARSGTEEVRAVRVVVRVAALEARPGCAAVKSGGAGKVAAVAEVAVVEVAEMAEVVAVAREAAVMMVTTSPPRTLQLPPLKRRLWMSSSW